MIFVFDLDDTICNTDGYSEMYIKCFFKKHNLPYKQIAKTARFAEEKFDWSHEEAIKWYKEYGDIMFLYFPIKNNALNVINQLYDNGHKIIICTARDTNWHSEPEKLTLLWLQNNGLKYHKIYFGREDKEKVCEMENADVFVDDDIKITSRVQDFFNSIGHGHAFLSATSYNQTQIIPNNIKVIQNFDEMLENLNIFSTEQTSE